ncbi:MAG: hypothetical protein FWJ87_04310 [Micromonosporaceae bacterium]|jgi:hypothetical protein
MGWFIRRARAMVACLLGVVGRLATRRVAAPAVAAAAVVVAGAVALLGRDPTYALLVLVLGTVAAGVVHGHRQRRMIFDELRRQAVVQDFTRTLTSLTSMVGEVRDRQRLTALTLGRLSEDLASATADTRRLVGSAVRGSVADLEALLYLRAALADAPPPPWTGPSHPEAVMRVVAQVWTTRPKTVVVCGDAGLAVWCAVGIRHVGVDARVVALDHDGDRVAGAARWSDALSLADLLEIRHAALERYRLDDREVRWYPRPLWTDLGEVGTVVVAGPADEDPRTLPLVLGGLLATDGSVLLTGPAVDEAQVAVLEDELSMRATAHGPTTTLLTRG